MLLGVDHLVIGVGDLGAAMRDYAALGFSVVPGGRHAAGTHNALIALADGAYLELVAFHEPYPAHRWWAALERQGKDAESEAAYREAIRLRPEHAEAHARLAAVLERLGRTDEALAACREAARLEPGDTRYRHALDALRHRMRA